MGWSKDRRRFAGAMILFVVWIGLLTALAIFSSYRPASRAHHSEPPAAGAHADPLLSKLLLVGCPDYNHAMSAGRNVRNRGLLS
jgi:hypothetical protein